jgi:hypothetical protein
MPEVEATPVKKSRKGCWVVLGIFGFVFLAAALFYGPAISDFLKVYGIESLTKPERHKYNATSEENLKALYQGMILFHDSEGQFPPADKWMDSIESRLRTNDLIKAEEKKKLIRPDLVGQPNKFGYAMNDLAGTKYKEDVKDPATTPLIYESKQTGRNAHGDPTTDLDGIAIAIDGNIIRQ